MKLNTKRTFRYFWKQVARYKGLSLLLIFSLTAAVLSSLVIPYYFKRFFDTLVAPGETSFLVQSLITLLFIILFWNIVQWVFWRIASFSNAHFQSRIMANIANECFAYLHRHSYHFFSDNFVGSLVKNVNRLVRAFEGLADKIYYDLIPLFLKLFIIFGILFWLHPTIGLIMLGWTLFFLFFNYRFSVYKLKYDMARAKADTRVSGVLADTISNNANIKFFSSLSYELDQFRNVTDDWFKKMRLEWNLGQIAESIQVLLMIFLEFALFYFAIRFWERGILTLGDFVWIQAYLLDLFGKLWNFGRIIRDFYTHLADAEEMIVILHTNHDVRDLSQAGPIVITRGKIEFQKVCFTYPKGNEVIHQLDLRIKPGERVALIGPSGGGKSTITKLLLRLFDVTDGAILIDDQDTARVTQDSLRSQIAFVPQDPILFHRTLLENIRYGRREASDEEVMAAAKLAHCHAFIMNFPQEYNTYVGERGVKLSGGERQRVAIARAILANAPILILDEATSSLDSESEIMIQEALTNLMKQKTTLVIAHRLSTIMRMDRIVVLQGGNIVEEGTHADLVSQNSGLYKKLWDLQVGGYVNQ